MALSLGPVLKTSLQPKLVSLVLRRSAATLPTRKFDTNYNFFQSGVQRVHAGTQCLESFVVDLKTSGKRPLIVTDAGLIKAGVAPAVAEHLQKQGLTPAVFSDCQPNPSFRDTISIAKHYFENKCDSIVGVGGGGPLDAAKGGMALIAKKKVDASFDLDKNGPSMMDNIRAEISAIAADAAKLSAFTEAIPKMGAISTTAGTGSEGGKSAVITNTLGVKVVFGHPMFFPLVVALVPQFTRGLPPTLTATTGIDALFHCMEAYFVTTQAGLNDGLDMAGIELTEEFALTGIELVVRNLEKAFLNGNDLEARLNMLFAAFFGAKAFRKGDLGGVHATAHALGSLYHLHHGASIARMAVPVLSYNSKYIDSATKVKFEMVNSLFKASQPSSVSASLHDTVHTFLSKFQIPLGFQQLERKPNDIETLTKLATNDPCQTNPVPLNAAAYRQVFLAAEKL